MSFGSDIELDWISDDNDAASSISSVKLNEQKSSFSILKIITGFIGIFTLKRLKWLLIRLVIATILFTSILVSSSIAYTTFYWLYMPVMHHEMPVYFNYDGAKPPTAILPNKDAAEFHLRSGIAYDFILDLSIPDIPGISEKLGNFMATLDLADGSQRAWYHSARPGLLPYRSGLVRFASNLVRLVPILLGWAEEKFDLRIFLAESVQSDVTPTFVKLALSNPVLPLYSAKLLVIAHLSGIRYYMYHWKVTCFFGSIAFLVFSQICSICTILLFAYLRKPTNTDIIQERSVSPKRGRRHLSGFSKAHTFRQKSPKTNGLRHRRTRSVEQNHVPDISALDHPKYE
jgi:hypothetical protein